MGTQKITMTITSTGGCTVTVDGTASWEGGVLTAAHNFGFKGTFTFGGKAGCPTGTLEFKSAQLGGDAGTGREMVGVLDVPNPSELRKITWHAGDRRMAALLNDPSANAALCARLRSVAGSEPKPVAPERH